MKFVQRYPFAPKAMWWKRYNDKASLGKRTIYVATDELGFEITGIPQKFTAVALTDGTITTDDQVEYIALTTTEENVVTLTKAIELNGVFYQYNVEDETMEAHDVADEDLEIVTADLQDVIRFEKNTYMKKYAFDCTKETDQQSADYQPIDGLLTNSQYLTIKTHNFTNALDEPKPADLIYYQKRYWAVEEKTKTYIYTPRERTVLHLSLKAINK